MLHYFVLSYDPSETSIFSRMNIHSPLNKSVELDRLLIEQLGVQPGEYLIQVRFEVEVLQSKPIPQPGEATNGNGHATDDRIIEAEYAN